jgi:hypothetical protein
MSYPGTASARRRFPPSVPGFNADVGGASPVEHALRTQHAAREQNLAWRAAHSPDIDPDMLKDNAGAFAVSDAALALAPALDAVKAQADEAQAKVDGLVQGQRVGDDVASQLKAQRDWARAKFTMDSIKDGSKAVAAARDLIASADESQLPVLAEELDSYLSARSLPTGWLTTALAQKIPGLDSAQADATLLARQHAVLAANHADLTKAFARDTAPPPLLDPYAPAINSKPYTNGEPTFGPTNAE